MDRITENEDRRTSWYEGWPEEFSHRRGGVRRISPPYYHCAETCLIMPTTLLELSYAVEPRTGAADGRLYPYQQAAVEQFLMGERHHGLLGHHPGAGKTPMGLCISAKASQVCVIAPPSICRQWQTKICEWFPGATVYRCENGAEVTAWSDGEKPAQVVIIPDSLAHCASPLPGATVIVDELHRFKNQSARRTTALFGGKYQRRDVIGLTKDCERIIGLTGTPVISSPVDLYPFLHAVGFPDAKNFNDFCEHYCPPYESHIGQRTVLKYDRPIRMPEFAAKIRQSVLVRPRREEYLDQLPSVTSDTMYITVTDPAEQYSADQVATALTCGNKVEAEEMAKLRRLHGIAKAEEIIPAIKDMIEGGERPVIWCWHREVCEIIARAIDGDMIHGGVASLARTACVERFCARQTPALVATISSMGTGIDGLQHATDFCMFVERSFVPAENEQALARVHRTGQLRPVRVLYIESDSNLDAAVRRANSRKTRNSTESLQ